MLKLCILVCFTVNVLVDSIPLNKSVMEEYIIGGRDTNISEVPYQIAMYLNDLFHCGGFIVSPTHVVTAAHCVYGLGKSQVAIRAGSSSNQEGGEYIKAKKLYIHPKYNDRTVDYDVAIIHLQTPLEINNKTIKPIKLISKEPSAASDVLVSGWGRINEEMQETKRLQSVVFPVCDRTKCATIYKNYGVTLTPRMMCAGADGKSFYYGDSGGPAACKGEVVGIVSFAKGFGNKNLPGVYCNIADPEITKFIKDTAKL